MEGIQAEFVDIDGVFAGAMEQIYVSYSGEQPSFVYRRLCDMAGREEKLPEDQGFAGADAREAGIWLARWQAEDLAQRLGLLDGYRQAWSKRNYSLGTVTQK